MFLSLGFLSCSKDSGINPLPNFDAMWDYNHPDSTEIQFKNLLPLLSQTQEFAVSQDYHVELLTQIARSQGLQGKFAEAGATLQEAEKLLTSDMHRAQIRFMLEKGRLLNSMGETENATKIFTKAYEYGLDHNLDLYTVDAAHMLGIVDSPEKQIRWNETAFEIVEKSEDQRCQGWFGALANNLGWTYFDLGNYEKALVYFQKGYDWRQQHSDEIATRIAKWSIARCLRAMERYDEALKIQQELETEIVEKKAEPDGYVFSELAELYNVSGNTALQKEYAVLAYNLLSRDPWIVENEPETLQRLLKLGK
jgi:tetratricopeptide (TPR) repeat protein